MNKAPSDATKLRAARSEVTVLMRDLVGLRTERDNYRARGKRTDAMTKPGAPALRKAVAQFARTQRNKLPQLHGNWPRWLWNWEVRLAIKARLKTPVTSAVQSRANAVALSNAELEGRPFEGAGVTHGRPLRHHQD